MAAIAFWVPGSAQAQEVHLGSNQSEDGHTDFNGDGRTDIFRTTGTGWYASYGIPNGMSQWVKLRDSTWTLGNGLNFGDFDGDGRTDVFLSWGGSWNVSYGGTSDFTWLRSSDITDDNLAFGDFDGNGVTDVFYPNGTYWYVSYNGRSNWTQIKTSGYTLPNLGFADFDGDGRTDVLRTGGGIWSVSYSGSSAWTTINSSGYTLGYKALVVDAGDLGLADLNADGKTDVMRGDANDWYVSWGGTSAWQRILSGVQHEKWFYFADFNADGREDVYAELYASDGWKIWYNYELGGFAAQNVYPTGTPPDTTPPVISSVRVASLSPTSARIAWSTNEPATSQVQFGFTTSYGQQTSRTTSPLTRDHVRELTILGFTELVPDTLYHYRVLNWDAAGNMAVSVDHSFRTPPLTASTSTTVSTSTSTTSTTAPPGTGTTTTTAPPPATTTTTAPPRPVPQFSDVPPSNSYHDAIYGLAGQGIVSGYTDNTFRPQNPVLRAQFAKMICGAMNLTVTESTGYRFKDLGNDLPGSLYPHEYVGAAAAQRIILGYSDNTFRPYVDVTRAQVITMAVRAARNLKPGLLSAPPSGATNSVGNFDPTHGPNLTWAQYNGLLDGLQGYGSSWDPWQRMSRGEVAQVLWNLLNK